MKKIAHTLSAPIAVTAITTVLIILSIGSAKAQFDFIGATSSDPTVNSNYEAGAAPTFPVNTTTQLYLDDSESAAANPFDYTAAQGTSTFGYLYTAVGYNSTAGDEITGGTVNFGETGTGGFSNVLGFSDNSSLSVTGGTVNFLGTGYSSDGNSLEMSFQGNSTLNVSGGLVTTADGLGLGWYKGSATVNLSGGTIDLLGTTGTKLDSLNSSANATGALNFLAGNGVYEETASAVFASGIKVNFSYQTGDQFTLTSLDSSPFSALAAAGNLAYQTTAGGPIIALNNTVGTANYYGNYLSVTDTATTETLSVIAAPEPSTWALMLGGLGVLVFIQRKRLSNV